MTTNKVKSIKKTVSKIFSAICVVIISVLIILTVYIFFCNITGRIAFIGNYAVLKILTPSMEPEIPHGNYIEIRKISAENVKVGDVIVFVSRDPAIYGYFNTHRVVRIEEASGERVFYTKGDNNPSEDSLTTAAEDIRAVYIKKVPILTSISDIFSNKWVFLCAIIFPSLAILFICVINVIKKSEENRKDKLIQEEVERLKAEDEAKKRMEAESENKD